MIPITPLISIDEDEIDESFVRASGAGGQNVNKTSSAVQLRFDARNSPNLPEFVRDRLPAIAGQRMTQDGVIVLFVQTHRSQALNRKEALDRLIDLIRDATIRKPIRRPTRPTLASKKRRLETKDRRSVVKTLRRNTTRDE
ncbi:MULTISPECIES: alternative ribosome rescue aminoacyl-tRNA hydrolase ArfB [Lichenihabitans]|uniref:alternative ribosome rescue aminoacyl-tRNA hydrolase ArfB n=1 Tax=Lichenihabitans TaxID=2723776 RepID=UPI00103699EA|nr:MULTISPECIES: alternative ribosome rescue aminoacyl-tRNA hydrolase ArfB [Lichenihabitans]UDL96743.1 aminoacyl-tRNA hydrolase [Lichenihabitans sp. PAMC28606]